MICLGKGIFQYRDDKVRELAAGDETILYDPGKSVTRFATGNADDLFLLGIDRSSADLSLHKYEKADEAKEISSTLRVYPLEGSATVRQAIALFEGEHPDVQVKFEVGLNSKGMTAEDALKTLNTEMLAGNGPDVPVCRYRALLSRVSFMI